MLKKLLSIILITFTTVGATAQVQSSDYYRFKQYSTPDGLPNNMVHQVYQDNDGFLWVATYYGLFRYDGYNVSALRTDFHIKNILPSSNVLCVRENAQNRLFIGTHGGLSIYNKRTGAVKSYTANGFDKQRLNDIYVASDKKVYLGYIRGMAYYDEANDSVVAMTHKVCEGDIPEGVNIQGIIEDANHNLIIGTWSNGLYHFDVKTKVFTHFNPFGDNTRIVKLYRDSNGSMWAGTWGSGFFRFKIDVKNYKVDYEHWASSGGERSLISNYVLSICEDANKCLWLGTRDGVSIMPLGSVGTFTNYQEKDNRHYLPAHEITSVMRSNNGIIWLGSQGDGILRAEVNSGAFTTIDFKQFPAFNTNHISGLYVEPNGAIWAGIGYGIGYLHGGNAVNVTSSKLPYAVKYSRRTNEILAVTQDCGVTVCNGGKVLRQYLVENCGFIPHNLVFDVCEDHDGNWWVGSYRGLGIKYKDGREFCMSSVPGAHNGLLQETTQVIETADKTIWLCTNGKGVVHISGKLNNPRMFVCQTYSHENEQLPVDNPSCIYQDKKGRIWVGAEGAGLCQYDTKNDCFTSVHAKYNLPGNMVNSIQEDENGNLWIGTNNGLACLILDGELSGKVRVFTVADGLPDNFFNIRSAFFRDGVLYFGCANGIVAFRSDIVNKKSGAPSIHITDIVIDGKSLSDYDDEVRTKISKFTPDFTNKIVIPYNANSFEIEFASLTYTMPKQNRYAYKLEGYDKEWQYVDSDHREARYSNLASGTYVFKVKGTNENGEWSEVKTITVVITPPWWLTWWAFMLYIVAAFTIFYFVLKNMRNRMALRNRIRVNEMEKHKVEELNHIKLQFFTNITHELMTPLTIISASLDDLKERVPEAGELARTMDVNVHRLIRLLQQILEFRKAETGNLKLRVAKGDLAQFVRQEAESFESLIRKKQLHFSVMCEEDVMNAYFDCDKVDKILYNLLSNSAKYSNTNGYILLTLKYLPERDHVQLSVKDNGKGISKERQKDLFTRFYEGDYRQKHTIGTGIGLSLVRDLVNLHKGSISVESEEGKGTEFLVKLPICKEAYSDEEIIEIDNKELNSSEAIVDKSNYEDVDDNAASEPEFDENTPCILLVEDNEELLNVMYRLLCRNYRVLKASNGKDAFDILKSEDVNLVVSDILMPEMNGIELTKKVKADIEVCHIPIILLSAKRAEEDRDEGYTAGADAYLTKPFNLSALHARISSLLNMKSRAASDFKKQLVIDISGLDYTDMDGKFLSDAIACVNKQLNNSDFDVTQFCAEMATSRTTLYKKLRSLTGLTTTAFIRNIRLKAACKIMEENTNIRISDLAYTVGFNDPKYFSICFKKEFGMQPSEYIERYANKIGDDSKNADEADK